MNLPDATGAWLERVDGAQLVTIVGSCAIGRSSDNDIPIPDPRASRRHAVIHAQGGEFWLVDLGSSNGTFVNGRRVVRPVRLQNNDDVSIADRVFRFRVQAQTLTQPSDGTVSGATMIEIRNEPCWLLVADLADFTTLSQRLTPDQLAETVGRWLGSCKEVIEQQGGAINKYLGDGFVAYWREANACPTARVAAALVALQTLRRRSDIASFRVAIHHGIITIGGSGTLGEESLMGPEVNLVFRLEKLAAELGLAICLSTAADALLKPFITTERHPGSFALKGFTGTHHVAFVPEPPSEPATI